MTRDQVIPQSGRHARLAGACQATVVSLKGHYMTDDKQPFPPRRKRAPMSADTYRTIRERLAKGHFQHDIAADLGINQGRVSEVKTGKRGSGDAPELPF